MLRSFADVYLEDNDYELRVFRLSITYLVKSRFISMMDAIVVDKQQQDAKVRFSFSSDGPGLSPSPSLFLRLPSVSVVYLDRSGHSGVYRPAT